MFYQGKRVYLVEAIHDLSSEDLAELKHISNQTAIGRYVVGMPRLRL